MDHSLAKKSMTKKTRLSINYYLQGFLLQFFTFHNVQLHTAGQHAKNYILYALIKDTISESLMKL